MIVLFDDILESAARKRADARVPLQKWLRVTVAAAWQHLPDVRRDFASADGVSLAGGRVVTVFNIRGNTYWLLTVIHYPAQTVEVFDLPTHAEYDKELWKRRP